MVHWLDVLYRVRDQLSGVHRVIITNHFIRSIDLLPSFLICEEIIHIPSIVSKNRVGVIVRCKYRMGGGVLLLVRADGGGVDAGMRTRGGGNDSKVAASVEGGGLGSRNWELKSGIGGKDLLVSSVAGYFCKCSLDCVLSRARVAFGNGASCRYRSGQKGVQRYPCIISRLLTMRIRLLIGF